MEEETIEYIIMNYELRIMNLRYGLTVRITNLRELRMVYILSLGIK